MNGLFAHVLSMITASAMLAGAAAANVAVPARKVPIPEIPSHVSMYYTDNQDFFADSLKPFATTTRLRSSPRVFIVNQHMLAASLVAHQFALSADPRVTKVFILTQNNWSTGTAPMITSVESWKTPLGAIQPATGVINDLLFKRIVTVDETIFDHEHGITGIVPYIAYAFPHATIVPIVIRDKTSDAQIDALASTLLANADQHTVIIGAIDMSHYLPKPMADAHDRLTEQTIAEFDYASIPKLDIDTAPTLRAVMKAAESLGLKKFVETGHANSADITNEFSLTSTTSYVTGYFEQGASSTADAIHAVFVGDIMLDRGVAMHADARGSDVLFKDVERLFLGNDMVVGNLEGPITGAQSVSRRDTSLLRFTFDSQFAHDVLTNAGFTALSLANNHTNNFGRDGYDSTQEQLATDNILPFGSPFNDANFSTRQTVRGRDVCLVGYEQFIRPDPAPFVKEITSLRPSCYRIVVFSHWGVEYSQVPLQSQRDLAHAFIDAGADVVIGAHPHVVQSAEVYKGKAIFYSLGNFEFDQDFSFNTTHALTLGVEFSDAETRFTLMPINIVHSEVSPADATSSAHVLAALVNNRMSKNVATGILASSTFVLPHTPDGL